ncbi:hypothetical protein JT073_01205 [Helicobacter pylori]|nr:hypothetical protein [Helicobacter pylori]
MNLKEIIEGLFSKCDNEKNRNTNQQTLELSALIDKHKQHPNRQKNNATLIRYVFS